MPEIINEVHKGELYIKESSEDAGTIFEINIPAT